MNSLAFCFAVAAVEVQVCNVMREVYFGNLVIGMVDEEARGSQQLLDHVDTWPGPLKGTPIKESTGNPMNSCFGKDC